MLKIFNNPVNEGLNKGFLFDFDGSGLKPLVNVGREAEDSIPDSLRHYEKVRIAFR